jgi:hypothetical protein
MDRGLDEPPALAQLSHQLGLTPFEQDILLLCIAMELDTRTAALCAHAQDNANRPHPTFALGLALFDEPSWDALSPERPLRYWRLVEINQPGAQPLTTSALRADERIVNYVKGLNYLDDRLASFIAPLEIGEAQIELPESQQACVGKVLQAWGLPRGERLLPAVQLLGPDSLSKQLVAWHAAATLGRQLYRIPVELLPSQSGDLETLARLWQRESMLLPIALYLDASEIESSGEAQGQALRRILAKSDGFFFVGTRELWPALGRPHVAIDVAKPTPSEQQRAWSAALAGRAKHAHGPLAAQFSLNTQTLEHIARAALAEEGSDDDALAERVWHGCRAAVRPGLDALAQRLDAKATWSDIVLPDEQSVLLRQIAAQVNCRRTVYGDWGFARTMNRGLGISALFAGDSGTGKTMAAEVIANELRLNLYRIDLSAVVSKYIGQTEKNLRRLFDAAEDGGAILFFDEADALFGKRSEVKDSHDRYANIEINYLLQRIESYRGLAILATNMKSSLDTAFVRRLRFIVDFPFPGVAERQLIWQKAFPPETPRATLAPERLARLNLTGANIHSAALNAAFLAAQAGTAVTMRHVLASVRTEFLKLGRPIDEADFRLVETQGVAA